MTIQKIKWNGRVQDVTRLAEKVGTKFICDEIEVGDYQWLSGKEYAKEITEDSLSVFSIHYFDGKILRIYNPIEVLFVP
jgi:hypothetical protein